jgi:hypothetical protein
VCHPLSWGVRSRAQLTAAPETAAVRRSPFQINSSSSSSQHRSSAAQSLRNRPIDVANRLRSAGCKMPGCSRRLACSQLFTSPFRNAHMPPFTPLRGHPLAPLQDRRALCSTSTPDIRRGPSSPSQLNSHRRAITPWRIEAGRAPPPRDWRTSSMGSRASRPSSPSADDLFDARRPVTAPSEPSPAVLHQSLCYQGQIRPWRHTHWAGAPSPQLPRQPYRPASRGVLPQPKPRRIRRRENKAARTKHAKPRGAATSADIGGGGGSGGMDGALRRFLTHEVLSTSGRKRPIGALILGVSAQLLEDFLAMCEEEAQQGQPSPDAEQDDSTRAIVSRWVLPRTRGTAERPGDISYAALRRDDRAQADGRVSAPPLVPHAVRAS